MHKKSMEAAAHLEQVEKSSDASESDSEDVPSNRSSISTHLTSNLQHDKRFNYLKIKLYLYVDDLVDWTTRTATIVDGTSYA
ncbi:hypothetical protein DICVIV_10513 [Dictyocaulus viviparus]|uniref:Uncharacterized protein n=1 Tax=Dictyocaulus viviparus TaxID=29172 RepID=A0A0D8XI73_DICVI|nr:hypothetical protein DICVIV_10513 [Dictyocaulus viviparus]